MKMTNYENAVRVPQLECVLGAAERRKGRAASSSCAPSSSRLRHWPAWTLATRLASRGRSTGGI